MRTFNGLGLVKRYWLSLIQRTLFCRVVAQLGLLVVFWLSLAGPSSRQGFGYKVWQNYKAQATFAVPATEGIGVLNKPVSPQDTFLIPELLEPFWSRVRKDRNGRFMAIAGFQWSVSEFAKPKTEFAQVGLFAHSPVGGKQQPSSRFGDEGGGYASMICDRPMETPFGELQIQARSVEGDLNACSFLGLHDLHALKCGVSRDSRSLSSDSQKMDLIYASYEQEHGEDKKGFIVTVFGFVDGDDGERNSDWLVLFSLTCLCCSFVLGVLGLDRIGHHRRIGWCIILISAILLLFGYGSVYFGFPWRWRL